MRLLFFSLLLPILAQGLSAQQSSLRSLAESKGKLIGTALRPDYIRDSKSMPQPYQKIAASEFNLYVAENDFKMAVLLSKKPKNPFQVKVTDLNTERIDNLVKQARANRVTRIRGHALIWYRQAPDWLIEDAKKWNSAQITSFATSYITAVLTYCKQKAPEVYEWDVFNEAINGNPAAYRSETWYDGVSDKQAFIDACFRAARKADPKVRLVYNDFNIELNNGGTKNAFMLEMVAGMKKRGVSIDAVGLQCHFTGPDPSGKGGFSEQNAKAFRKTFVALKEIGLDCIVTELDLRMQTDSENGEGKVTVKQLEEQGKQYQRIAATALAEPNCPALLVWGFSDAYSWIPKQFPGFGHGLLYDEKFQKKPAYEGLRIALEELPKR